MRPSAVEVAHLTGSLLAEGTWRIECKDDRPRHSNLGSVRHATSQDSPISPLCIGDALDDVSTMQISVQEPKGREKLLHSAQPLRSFFSPAFAVR